ncbi:MAG: hexulose-6-phosphate isomerase [Nitrospirae bacterium GWC2_46_6]|nr:MAG: hexulose-6-phosphate isomerase [Nitrospirae bacterium GWC2_46_6]OGW22248.1 MAG: hexulose-6-phosphate isomerase [Nitrospirae bacterium GWA2_46_11]OGW23219.1 MAG: hexulose-6-phosphate isomerase [Nitrospirae bacterium GWB2_47_37]HAK87772.1 hexulose-6-phosphate isomerase [Nitrospiraceae bacterium]
MSKTEKLLQRFLLKPKDFTFEELGKLLKGFGYEEAKTGRASGSRVAFINRKTKSIIRLHRPHPSPELKRYQLDDVEEALRKVEVIK